MHVKVETRTRSPFFVFALTLAFIWPLGATQARRVSYGYCSPKSSYYGSRYRTRSYRNYRKSYYSHNRHHDYSPSRHFESAASFNRYSARYFEPIVPTGNYYVPPTQYYDNRATNLSYVRTRRDLSVDLPAPSRTPIRQIAAPAPSPPQNIDSAWKKLREGNYLDARKIFRRVAKTRPQKTAPKIGYALAFAFSGKHNHAAGVMRRAFRLDANHIALVERGRKFSRRLTDLADFYQAKAAEPTKNRGANFMLAAVSYVNGDWLEAKRAVDAALKHGDTDASTFNLRSLLEAKIGAKDTAQTPS